MLTLEQRLREALGQAGDAWQKARAQADLAACLARLGRYPEAERLLGEVPERARWGSAELASALLFAQAMVALRNEFDPAALDRLRRGHAIACAARLPQAAVDFASWAVHAEFNQDRLDEMERWVSQCLDLLSAASPMARARLALTCATAWLATGHRAEADAWFARVRAHVSRSGDEAFMAAALYNRAAYGVWLARLEQARDRPVSVPLSHLLMEVESAEHYAVATGNDGARQLQRLWKARALMLLDRHAEALELLDDALARVPEAAHAPFAQFAASDRIACLVACRRHDEARAAWSAADGAWIDEPVDADDAPLQSGADGLLVWMRQRSDAAARLGLPATDNPALRAAVARRHAAYVARLEQVVRRLHAGLLPVLT